MTGEGRAWGKALGIAVCVLVVAAGGVWGAKYWLDQREQTDVEAKLASGDADEMRDALLSLDPEKLDGDEGKNTIDLTTERMRDMSFSEIMEVMRSKDLTEEQRRHLRQVGREVMMASMNKNVDEYFNAAKEEREAVLDRHIDEMTEFLEQMRAYREEHKDDPEFQEERERERQAWRTRNRQDAKDRMEGGNPDQQKRMFAYWGRMRDRTKARGINMWGGREGGASKDDRSSRPRRRSDSNE